MKESNLTNCLGYLLNYYCDITKASRFFFHKVYEGPFLVQSFVLSLDWINCKENPGTYNKIKKNVRRQLNKKKMG